MKSDLKQLDVGLRGTLREFKATYTTGFLKKARLYGLYSAKLFQQSATLRDRADQVR